MSYAEVEYIASRFLRIDSLDNLAMFLETPLYALEFVSKNKVYKEFYVGKPSGGKRLIEDPEDVLKGIQQKLNEALQAVYYLNRSAAAYGFQITVANEKHPRNIVTNTELHLNKSWMLNADFNDFFHQIDTTKLLQLFAGRPFNFNDMLAIFLTDLVCFKGRLPMGAPTSPVLSNFAVLELDAHYLTFAAENQIVYTRFVDDLSFSAHKEISNEQAKEIFQIAAANGLSFNQKKVKFFKPEDIKTVTGLLVTDKISLPESFIGELETEIQKFANTWEVNTRAGQRNNAYLKKFRQQIEGRLQFAKFVLGEGNPKVQLLQTKYLKASQVDYFDTMSWADFGYQNLTDTYKYPKKPK
jgi:RNA-directed DNA polymerase